MSSVVVYDTTLRDGMQGEGMSLSAEEKVRVTHALDALGVHLIEAGFLSSNPKDEALFDLLARETFRHAEIVERDITRAELVLADEVFLSGTAAELTPVREIDDVEIGPPGQVTREIQKVFEDALHGRSDRYAHWLDIVPVPAKA